jgi:hypothetical protein
LEDCSGGGDNEVDGGGDSRPCRILTMIGYQLIDHLHLIADAHSDVFYARPQKFLGFDELYRFVAA